MSIQLAYLHSTLDHSKGQGQGHAHFDNKYHWNGDIRKNTIDIKYQVMDGLLIDILILDHDPF